MRIVIVGAAGQLGTALRRTAPKRLDVVELTRSELDITDEQQVQQHPAFINADVIINCAAYTAVDAAEKPSERDLVFAVNAVGAENLARRAAEVGAFFVQVSTDYVFGPDEKHLTQRIPWEETATTAPQTVYGASKLAGERAVFAASKNAAIVRTAWVFSGDTQPDSPCFVKTMLRLAAGEGEISVVDDQWGNPTFVEDLATGLWELAAARKPGVFQLTGTGLATWYQLAVAVFDLAGADTSRVKPVTSAQYERPAPRPHWSALSNKAWISAGFAPLPQWQAALRRAMEVG